MSALDVCHGCDHYRGNHMVDGCKSCTGCVGFQDRPALSVAPARATDPETSHIAHAMLNPASQQAAMLDAWAHASDLTDEEAAEAAGLLDLEGACWWHRASDLRAHHLVEVCHDPSTGALRKRVGRSNRPRMVSRITTLGRDVQAGRTPYPASQPPPVNSQPEAKLAVDLISAEAAIERVRQLCERPTWLSTEEVLAALDGREDKPW